MKKSPLLLTITFALTALVLPACQSPMDQQIINDQDKQLDAQHAAYKRQQGELERAKMRSASMQAEIEFERARAEDLDQRMKQDRAEQDAMNAELRELQERFSTTGITVASRDGVIVLGLPSALSFPSGKADLTKDGKAALDAVGDVISSEWAGRTFWVEGHTDNQQPKKSGWSSNLALSVARATGVAEYMRITLEVAPEQLRVSGHGEFSPLELNDSAEGREANRRVEILIMK
jgi:chemotaxis protein MotB